MTNPSLRETLDKLLMLMVRDHINFGADSESDEMFAEDKADAIKAILSAIDAAWVVPPTLPEGTYLNESVKDGWDSYRREMQAIKRKALE